MDINLESQNTQDTTHKPRETGKEGRPKCGYLDPSFKGNQYTHGSSYRDKVWGRDWRKGNPETAPPGHLSHIQSPNPDAIVDVNKFLLAGGWNSCSLSGSDSAWQVQKEMLTSTHLTEHRVPNEGAREKTQGVEGVFSSIGGTKSMNQPVPPELPGTKPPTKEYTHGGTHGSSCICSKGWPSWPSVGGEAIGPVNVLCSSVEECQDQEARVGGLVNRVMGKQIRGGGFWRETKKGDSLWNVYKENV